jgi:hypothetical protein
MREWDHSDGVGNEHKHSREILCHLEVVEENAAEDHGHFHLEDVKDQVYNPVGDQVHS